MSCHQDGLYIESASNEKTLIAEGPHVLTLVSCQRKQCKDKFGKDPNAEITKLLWQFSSNRRDDFGKPYVFEIWTKTKFGYETAALTKLLGFLVPGITQEKACRLNIHTLLDRRYRAKIVHRTNKAGTIVADYVFLDLIEETEDAVVVAPPQPTSIPTVCATPKDMAWGNDND